MRLIKNIFVLSLLVFCCKANAQDLKDTTSGSLPVSIYSIECKLIDMNYVLDYRTHYSQYIVIQGGFNFEVDLKLKLENNFSIPDSSIGVILQTWNGEKEKYILNPKYVIMKNGNYYNFYFEFESDKRNFATCSLVRYNKEDKSFGPVNYGNVEVSRYFLLH